MRLYKTPAIKLTVCAAGAAAVLTLLSGTANAAKIDLPNNTQLDTTTRTIPSLDKLVRTYKSGDTADQAISERITKAIEDYEFKKRENSVLLKPAVEITDDANRRITVREVLYVDPVMQTKVITVLSANEENGTLNPEHNHALLQLKRWQTQQNKLFASHTHKTDLSNDLPAKKRAKTAKASVKKNKLSEKPFRKLQRAWEKDQLLNVKPVEKKLEQPTKTDAMEMDDNQLTEQIEQVDANTELASEPTSQDSAGSRGDKRGTKRQLDSDDSEDCIGQAFPECFNPQPVSSSQSFGFSPLNLSARYKSPVHHSTELTFSGFTLYPAEHSLRNTQGNSVQMSNSTKISLLEQDALPMSSSNIFERSLFEQSPEMTFPDPFAMELDLDQ